MVADVVLMVVLVAGALGEWAHARRVRRLRYLAFGPRGEPAGWTRLAPAARVLGLAAFLWGSATLYEASDEARLVSIADTRRLVLALDVSPSMELRDAGPLAQQTRRQRAAEVFRLLLEPVSETCKISVVAFYQDARPVVVDTVDREIVANILDGLPLAHAFVSKRKTTNVAAGIQGACEIAAGWPPQSATLLLVTDGDSEEADKLPVPPPAVARVVVLGVGSVHGRKIAGHDSAQRTGFLRGAAERLGHGVYCNCNDAMPPPDLLSHLAARWLSTRDASSFRFALAVAAVVAGGSSLAAVSGLLSLIGSSWRPGVPRSRDATRPARAAGRV